MKPPRRSSSPAEREFEPFTSASGPSVMESLALLAGLEAVTRASTLAHAQSLQSKIPPPIAPQAPNHPTRYTSQRREYLPALEDPAVIHALLDRARSRIRPSARTTKPLPQSSALAPPMSTPVITSVQPKPRRLSAHQTLGSYGAPILTSSRGDKPR